MKLLLWLAGAWLILRVLRVLEERHAALDRQDMAKRERLARRQSQEQEWTPASVGIRIKARWRDAEHAQALIEDAKRRKPIRPIPFRRKA